MSTPNPSHDEKTSVAQRLADASLDEIDQVVRTLKKEVPACEIRAALVERIARAPLSEFAALKVVYLSHCAD